MTVAPPAPAAPGPGDASAPAVVDVDVVVLGTGAAGLTTAVVAARAGARVAVFEKADEVGGTTAWSGGHVWVPCHPHQAAIGVEDSPDLARTYILSLSRGLLEERLVDAYVAAAPEMVRFLDAEAGTEFTAVADFPDYHPEHPGGLPGGGRTIECPLFAFAELGEWQDRVTRSPYFSHPAFTMSETPLGAVDPVLPTRDELARRAVRDERGAGQALVGRLLKALLDLGVEPRTGCRGTRLVQEDDRVVGVEVETPDGPVLARAAGGVVLACGGFEWDEELKRAFLRGPLTHPVSVPTNTGDGLRMAMRVGAALSTMREAWWIPAADLPPGVNRMDRYMVNGDRTRPRSIMVNRRGRRFTNEAANYNAFGGAFHVEDVGAFDYANLPCWLVFDQEYLRRYGTVGPHPRGEQPPAWMRAYGTLRELADDLGIDADGLEGTVAAWNVAVADGHDPEFGRGRSAHDRWWGDPAYKRDVRGTLGPLDEAPFYAVQIHSGALGTKGGPRVDPDARVLDVDGAPVEGLYAAGNAMGSPFGATYGGAGGTLGPAMTFGYLAGAHAAARAAVARR
ncbi:FAD-dependent oxidoreductase [Nocardioides zeae]|uniref:FAD-dependent oxidoreductase n=1 Tax=Nocardioides imazamoxiresistens TaxID=3231893 RepID=A0ABU3PR20_9ACTN|nr:FAD-dependent oxidoreductase [Nocardioides zeae]MDT9591668.1 FAD-dependent oxidoreductase [Nocardioides zeae]